MTNNYGRTHDQTFRNSRTYDYAQPPNHEHTTKYLETVELRPNATAEPRTQEQTFRNSRTTAKRNRQTTVEHTTKHKEKDSQRRFRGMLGLEGRVALE